MKALFSDFLHASKRLIPGSVKLADFINPQCYRGMWRLWAYDIGSISFLLTALVGIAIALLSAYVGKTSAVSMMLSMSIASTVLAVAWQINRLVATETSRLIPGYQRNVVVQACAILFGCFILTMLLALGLAPQGINTVLLSSIVALAFLVLSLRWQHGFQFSMLLFIGIVFIDSVAAQFSPVLLIVLMAVMIAAVRIQFSLLSWHANARQLYLNGMEMGWVWVPNLKQSILLHWLNRQLHPINFFVGPLLALLLIFIVLIGSLLFVLSNLFGWDFPVPFLAGQLLLMAASLVHWTRLQRWRSSETLFLLPCFSGLVGLQKAFHDASYRFVGLSLIVMLLVCLVGNLFGQGLSFLFIIHLLLATGWGVAMALGFGAISRSVSQLSVSMVLMIAHSVFISLSFDSFEVQANMVYWLVADGTLLLLAIILLTLGRKQLWKNGLMDQ
ncbi:hypothetical protein [Shewanella glacialimarina]|uniref:hypothetical protein n=1 Tax=Shewanella glacialimarina TaxID=2590884 RepID=UPI001CF8E7A2|nr:hypothetical protein [Shewanella glacialimarina]UCX06423.1 hypothetical protein FJ709_19100 [Shewanella glacialimarina]